MSAPNFVMVHGLPGVGKSQVARQIAARYRLPLLTKDGIKEILFDTLGTGEPRWSSMLSNASFATQFAVAAELLRSGVGVLLEGNFRSGEHQDRVRGLLGIGPSNPVQVLCRLPEEERLLRLEQRAARAERHAGHLDRLFLRRSATRGPSAADFLDLPGARIVHDTDDPFDIAWARLQPALDRCLLAAGAAP